MFRLFDVCSISYPLGWLGWLPKQYKQYKSKETKESKILLLNYEQRLFQEYVIERAQIGLR